VVFPLFFSRLPPVRDTSTIFGERMIRGETMDLGRRAFLRGRPRRCAEPLRPPGAVNESRFLRVCHRCGDCLAACSAALLVRGGGGFPEADFSRGHCAFCADCARACADAARKSASRRPALLFSSDPPWSLQAVIGPVCLSCRGVSCHSCAERCEAGAIRFSPPLVESSCTGCGRCVATCPTLAIAMGRRPDSLLAR
jgi:ferredoxin-type protein NapF